MLVDLIASSLPAAIVAVAVSLLHVVFASLTVHVTAVSAPSSRNVKVRLFPAPGEAESLTARSRATIVALGESVVTPPSAPGASQIPVAGPYSSAMPRPFSVPENALAPSEPAAPLVPADPWAP